jgi:hypothetical protein
MEREKKKKKKILLKKWKERKGSRMVGGVYIQGTK